MAGPTSSTGAGTRVDVTLKLSQLQNMCKRDPLSYRDDYEAQVRRLESELAILALQPSTEPSPRLIELMQFAAAVSSSSYKGTESDRIGNLLIGVLVGPQSDTTNSQKAVVTFRNSTSMPALQLHRDVRKTCVSALILMRNKGVLPPLRLMELFFRVMAAVPDKGLRELLYRHLVNDIRNINKKGKRDDAVNRSVQSFLHKVVSTHGASGGGKEEDAATDVAAKRATDLVCELYRRRVWTEERAVAILASAVQSQNQTVMCRAMRFFLNIEEKMAMDQQQKEEDEWNGANIIDFHAHSKKTARRQRQVERQLKNRQKVQIKKEQQGEWMDATPEHDRGVEASKKLYPAIELLRDPQGLAESVLKRLRAASSYKYEVKLLMINFCTRLVGNHELLVLPLYPFLQKYMGGQQRDVTAILAYTVQACHETVPPEEIFGILKTIAHNFITERCSEEQMAVGINACRAICARVPSTLAKEDDKLEDEVGTAASTSMDIEAFARELASFGNHRDRSVSISGKSWTNFIRHVHPGLLQGKDRGLKGSALHRAGAKPLRYGEKRVSAGVEGADLLAEYEAKKAARGNQRDNEDDDDEGDSGDEEQEEMESDDDEAPHLVLLDGDADTKQSPAGLDISKMSAKQRDKLKQEVSSNRIFSASDFEKMRKLVERERRAKEDPREAARRKRAIARGQDFEELSDDDEDDDSDSDEEGVHVSGAVNPAEIMAEARRKRVSKAEKLSKIIAGRTEFESRQRMGGSTNIEKKRKKNFVMSKLGRDTRAKGRGKAGLNEKTFGGKKQIGHEKKKRRRKM